MLFHIIADYGHGDLAFSEVVQRIKMHLPDAEPVLLPVPPFSTLGAGFCIAQLALNAAPAGTIIYHNVAPREDDPSARQANAGEQLAFARLPTGVRVIGVNAGYTFSFLRDAAEEFRWAAAPAEGSQFRSRDLFPQAAAAIALGSPDALGDEIPRRAIPEPPANKIAYIDGYGNLKTTFELSDVQKLIGKEVSVKIGGATRTALATDGSFAVEHGKLAFAPGSSGWTLSGGRQIRWMELFLRDGNAWQEFDRPKISDDIQLTKS